MKVLHPICQQIWKTQQWPWDWKMSIFNPIPKKGNAKECSNYFMLTLISYASNVMLKILQARLQQYMNWELPDVQAGFRKGRGAKDQVANIPWITEKAREFQKNFSFMDYSPPGSSVHGLLQARILEWNAITSSKVTSWPRDQIHISYVSCISRLVVWSNGCWQFDLWFLCLI